MSCYFCREAYITLTVHESCKPRLKDILTERTLCPKCGKCAKCDRPELEDAVRKQNYAIVQLSKRRYGIIHLNHTMGLEWIPNRTEYLGPHIESQFVKGCERLNRHTAIQRLTDLLYNMSTIPASNSPRRTNDKDRN